MTRGILIAAAMGWALAAPAAAQTAAEKLPLFDAHLHYSQSAWAAVPLARARAQLAAAGVVMAAISSTPDEGTMQLYRADADGFVPVLRPYLTGEDISDWHHKPSTPGYLAERLKLGVHKGIGEFHLSGRQAEGTVVEQTVALAVAGNLILHAHSDEDAVKRLFAMDGRARVLWAHAGFTSADRVKAMMAAYPNLWVEFAIRGDVAGASGLQADWRDLVMTYPDRILVGSDTYIVSRWQSYAEIMGEVRDWLLKLPPEVGQKLAYRNALKLFGVDEERFRKRLRQ